MSGQGSYANKWVVVEVHRQEFALPATDVQEIVAMPAITAVPMRRPQDRGVINLRGRIIPLIDVRKQFGWKSVPEELDDFYKLMEQREQDHRKWLGELERSVLERTEFHLATDPRKCAFGQWYYSYRSESPWIAALLRKFEPPHDRIHALALSIGELMKTRQVEEACRLIEKGRNRELAEMVSLFRQLKDLMREAARELAIVITATEKVFAISIDRAVAVESIPPDRIKEAGTAHRVAQRSSAGSLAVILEPEMFGLCSTAGTRTKV